MTHYKFDDKSRTHIKAALEHLKSIRIKNADGTVSYRGIHGYQLAFMVLRSVFQASGGECKHTTTRLTRAIGKVMKKGEVTVARLITAMETVPNASGETPLFYVTKPFYCRGVHQINRRVVNGCLVRLEKVLRSRDKGDFYSSGMKTSPRTSID